MHAVPLPSKGKSRAKGISLLGDRATEQNRMRRSDGCEPVPVFVRASPSAKKPSHVCNSPGLAGERASQGMKEALIEAMARSDYMQMRMGKENE